MDNWKKEFDKSLFNELVNITKADGYDILSEQVKELKEENKALKERVKYLEALIKEYTDKMIDNLNSITHE